MWSLETLIYPERCNCFCAPEEGLSYTNILKKIVQNERAVSTSLTRYTETCKTHGKTHSLPETATPLALLSELLANFPECTTHSASWIGLTKRGWDQTFNLSQIAFNKGYY